MSTSLPGIDFLVQNDEVRPFEPQCAEKGHKTSVVPVHHRHHPLYVVIPEIHMQFLDESPGDALPVVLRVDAYDLDPAALGDGELPPPDVPENEADHLPANLRDQATERVTRQMFDDLGLPLRLVGLAGDLLVDPEDGLRILRLHPPHRHLHAVLLQSEK
jgi:hypothetical protein